MLEYLKNKFGNNGKKASIDVKNEKEPQKLSQKLIDVKDDIYSM